MVDDTFKIIDDDFLEAATYYSARSFGHTKDECFKELKRRYEENEDLDNLVFIMARHRTKHSVPIEPTPEMDSYLTDCIISWLKMDGRKTPKRLFATLTLMDAIVPKWLKDDPHLQDLEAHIPRSVCAMIVYRSMTEGYHKGKTS